MGVSSRAELQCVNDAVGLCVAAITADDCLCMAQRSIELEACNAMWHLIPSGMLNDETGMEKSMYLQNWLVARLKLELGLEASEIGSSQFLGLLDSGREQGWTPDIVLTCRLQISSHDLLNRFSTLGLGAQKHIQLKCVGPLQLSRDALAEKARGNEDMSPEPAGN